MQDEERAAKSQAAGGQTTGSIQRPVRWFVDITSWEPIAMDLRQLVRAFDAGRIDADTLVWRKGMPDWRRLRDVTELAERLLGDAGADAASRVDSEAPLAAQGPTGTTEPPPRQSERSRTPPASYTVGDGRSTSEPPGAATGADGARGSVIPSAEADGLVGTDTAHDRSSRAPATAPRPERRKTPSRPSVAPAAPRTVTRMGLETPAEVAARNSLAPLGPSAAARDQRTSTPPGGVRRPASSDETPAQKPSSVSVPPPPRTVVDEPQRPRGLRVLALAAIVLGSTIIVRSFTGGAEEAPASAQLRTDAVLAPKTIEPKQVEKALEPSPVPRAAAASMPKLPAPAAAPSTPSSPPVSVAAKSPVLAAAPAPSAPARPPIAAPAAPSGAALGSPRTAAVLAPAALRGPAPSQPAIAGVEPRSADARAPLGMVPPAPSAHVAGALPGATTTAAAAPAVPPTTLPARPSAPAASATTTAAPARAAAAPAASASAAPAPAAAAVAPAEGAAGAPAEPPPRTRPFDRAAATAQLETAAVKAAACSSAGSTRGNGRVTVAIEPWGRVGRVTHLNQDFFGTPVGLCVMQAFQHIQVPPFDGDAQTISGSFNVP